MKTKLLFLYLITNLLFLSCTKEVTLIDVQQQSDKKACSDTIPPIAFSSIYALQAAIDNALSDAYHDITKSSPSGFISYAETVMREDGYDERPNAIMSEAFASILNPEGEVIFGNYALKLFNYGILYSLKEDLPSLRRLSKDPLLWEHLHSSSDFIFPLENYEKIYKIENEYNVYYYDMFDLFCKGQVNTKSTNNYNDMGYASVNGVVFHSFQGNPPLLNSTYTIPKGNKAQRNPFNCDSGAANDTKIYNENYLVTTQRGVKTKTVSKKALGWVKFKGNITAGVVNLYIWEPGLYNGNHYGWLDINETVYNGQTYIIATKVISGLVNTGMTNNALINDCNSAMTWAKEKGINVSNIDGVRYISNQDKKNVFVRIKDDVRTIYDDVLTIETKLKPEGNFHTKQSSLNNYVINNAQYKIYGICWYGYSQYYDEHRGTRLYYINNMLF